MQTGCGSIRGTADTETGVCAYLGIRYGSAPRWRYPVLVDGWEGVYDATHYGPCCIQQRTYMPEENSGRVFYYHEFREGIDYTYDEQCLYLNIWTPANGCGAPVLVYLHGGAFLGGSAQEKCFDGSALAAQGMVVVTVNFRLGIFGYAAFPELEARDGHAGNYGMYDAYAALEWVQKHIADFGGDPANVTLMGQSAGARMVQLLCLSPKVKGFVHRAVMCSGGGQVRLFGRQRKTQEVYPLWENVRKVSNASGFAQLESMPAPQLYAAFAYCIRQDFGLMQAACCPTADGFLLPLPIEEAVPGRKWLDIPYMIGSTGQDLMAGDLCMAAQNWLCQEEQPCYRYHFSRRLPGDGAGAFHSADLWYWFGSWKNSWRPFTDWDRELSIAMVRYLTAFMAKGSPELKDLPAWPATGLLQNSEMLCLGEKDIRMETVNLAQFPEEGGLQ